MRIDPPRSVPIAIGANEAATAAPDPPLEPPEVTVKVPGLRVVPKRELLVFTSCANSGCWSCPSTRHRRREALDASTSSSGRVFQQPEPKVVRSPLVTRLSFDEKGHALERPRRLARCKSRVALAGLLAGARVARTDGIHDRI